MGITVRNLELYQDSEVSYSESLKFGFGISRQFGIHDAWLLTTSLDLGYDRGPFYAKLSLFALLWDTLNFIVSTHISRHYNGYDVLSCGLSFNNNIWNLKYIIDIYRNFYYYVSRYEIGFELDRYGINIWGLSIGFEI